LSRSLVLLAALLLLACVVSLPLVSWFAQPWRPLRLALVDMTVPLTDYREHRSLVWVLNHHKYRDQPRVRDYRWDYLGFHPGQAARARSFPVQLADLSGVADSLEAEDLSAYEVLYLVDAYGVYRYVYAPQGERNFLEYEETLPRDRHDLRLVYGGISARLARQIEAFSSMGGTLVAEFNTLGYPTCVDQSALSRLERTLGVRTTGWVGKHYYDLELVDRRMKDLYERIYRERWNFRGPGLLVTRMECGTRGGGEDILVFPERELKKPAPDLTQILASPLFRGVIRSIDFRYWFEIVEPLPGAQTLATFTLQLKPDAEARYRSRGLPLVFPAIVLREGGPKSLYLAGDFADNPSSTYLVRFTGADRLMGWLSRGSIPENRFFWLFYVPFMRNALAWAKPAHLDPAAYARLLQTETPTLTAPTVVSSASAPARTHPSRGTPPARAQRRPGSLPPRAPQEPAVSPSPEVAGEPSTPPAPLAQAPAAPAPADSFSALRQRARELSWEKRYTESIALYKDLVDRYPDQNGALSLDLARVYSWAERYPESIQLYRALLAHDPTNRDIARELARVYSWDLRYAESLALYQDLSRQDPTDLATRTELARVTSWMGQLDASLGLYRDILREHPEATAARLEQARVLGWTGDYVEARRQYSLVLASEPNNVEALLGLSQVARYQGEPAWGRRYFRQAAQLEPDSPALQEEGSALATEFGPAVTIGTRTDVGSEFDSVRGVHFLDRRMSEWFGRFEQALPFYSHVSLEVSRGRYWEEQDLFDGSPRRLNFDTDATTGTLFLRVSPSQDFRILGNASVRRLKNRDDSTYYTLGEPTTFWGGALGFRALLARLELTGNVERTSYLDKVVEDPAHPLAVAARLSPGLALHWPWTSAFATDAEYRYARYEDDNRSHSANLRGNLRVLRRPRTTFGAGVGYLDFAHVSEDYWSPSGQVNPYASLSVFGRPLNRVTGSLTYTLGYYRMSGGTPSGFSNSFDAGLGVDLTGNTNLYSSFVYSENSEEYIYRSFQTALRFRW
jgi:tetratricopeptide (TPR) repeat protein